MHLPEDKINITWGQLNDILRESYNATYILSEIEQVDIINNICCQEVA